jgi:hypothetical protein
MPDRAAEPIRARSASYSYQERVLNLVAQKGSMTATQRAAIEGREERQRQLGAIR